MRYHPANFNGTALLLGAGFSKDFGGLLANEFNAQLVSDPDLNKFRKTRMEISREMNFEKILARLLTDAKKSGDFTVYDAVVGAVLKVFTRMDSEQSRHDHPVSAIILNKLLPYLRGNDPQKLGFIFTLNQDLLLERKCSTNVQLGPLVTPGVIYDNPSTRFPLSVGEFPWGVPDPAAPIHIPADRCINLIKLHGSSNWRATENGKRIVVMGDGKVEQIDSYDILSRYLSLFDDICWLGGTKLIVIGYSWNDGHINRSIFDAIKERDLKLYLISPGNPFTDLDFGVETESFQNAILGYYPGTMASFMPSRKDQSYTEEYLLMMESVFSHRPRF